MARKGQCNRHGDQAHVFHQTSAQDVVPDRCTGDQPTLHEDETGATALETVLLLGAIAIPSYVILTIFLNILTDHYGMLVTINSLPFP